ncbi:MAG: xanthine dehydrogenase small subunit [Parvularculaceae bacterium]
MRDVVRFRLDGVTHEIRNPDPTVTLLRWLRAGLRRTGAKEGCAEGDCGACTVAVSAPGEPLRAVNACILFLPMLDGAELWTAESLVGDDGALHPIQRALVEQHGSQCGFCTPGFVMSIFAHLESGGGTSRREIDDALAGNLCRCTGYGPIISAAQSLTDYRRYEPERLAPDFEMLAIEYEARGTMRRFHAPRSVAELAALALQYPEAVLLAGATDVGLWVTKQRREIETIISVMNVPELRELSETPAGLEIGAAVRYSEAEGALARFHPDVGELVRRIGGKQVRNCGTIGGNIANGSPIGDMPPALIAAGAVLVLRKGDYERRLPLEDYFLAYGEQDRARGEFVARVIAPRLPPGALFATYKVSKRFDQDISAVCGGFRVLRDGARVSDARLAFGGMAGVPKRAALAEKELIGSAWGEAGVRRAMDALALDFKPLTDQRGSSAYRLDAARNLLWRFFLENEPARAGATRERILDAAPVDV